MKTSIFLGLLLTTGVLAGTYEAPKLKLPSTPDVKKIETKTADWQDMNDTKLSNDEVPTRQLASDVEEIPVDPKDRGPSSNPSDHPVPEVKTAPEVSPDKAHQEKVEFWKYERVQPRSKH